MIVWLSRKYRLAAAWNAKQITDKEYFDAMEDVVAGRILGGVH